MATYKDIVNAAAAYTQTATNTVIFTGQKTLC